MKFTMMMFVHHRLNDKRESVFYVGPADMSKYTGFGAVIAKQEIEFDIDMPEDFDGVSAEVERLKAEQTKLRAEFQHALDENMTRINSLLAIEHRVAA